MTQLKYNDSISELELSVRVYNVLQRAGIDTVGRLSSLDLNDLKNLKGLGKTGIEELLDKRLTTTVLAEEVTPTPVPQKNDFEIVVPPYQLQYILERLVRLVLLDCEKYPHNIDHYIKIATKEIQEIKQ